MKEVILNNGIKIPLLGYGVYKIEDLDLCEKCVIDAIDVGYRLIDTASSYLNEEAVGNAIKKCHKPREELFITTKLWVQDTGYENTKKAFNKSMERLQLDYIDLYLIHQPFGDVYSSWRAMEDLYNQKRIRAIGVSNFYPDRLVDLSIHNHIKPAINQIEVNPFCQQIESDIFFKSYNVQSEAWSPFAQGEKDIFNNKILTEISKKYNKTVGQVILRWLTQRRIVALSKTTLKDKMEENFNIYDFELSENDMEIIKTLDEEKSVFFSHRDPEMVAEISAYRLDI